MADSRSSSDGPATFDMLLSGLRAAGEETRLRILFLCSQSELTVTDLTQILGQSQPRVSRHLKLLCDAGLLNRMPEGSWVLYRIAPRQKLVAALLNLMPGGDETCRRDRLRLDAIKQARARLAEAFFSRNAGRWDEIRRLHVAETVVEERLVDLLADRPIRDLLDVGTGTGRMLELFGPHIDRGLGIDRSLDMLAIARANLERAGLGHCQVRRADMYNLPLGDGSVDAVVVHQVLHFAETPAAAVGEIARVLRPDGRCVIVDFAPHELDHLREEQAHRRLGFAAEEIAAFLAEAGLAPRPAIHLPGDPLTVTLWYADKAPARASALTAKELAL